MELLIYILMLKCHSNLVLFIDISTVTCSIIFDISVYLSVNLLFIQSVTHNFSRLVKTVNNNGICSDSCPPRRIFDQSTNSFVANPNFKFQDGNLCVSQCPSKYNYV